MHHSTNYTMRHRYLRTSPRPTRPRSTVYLGGRHITVCNRSNPVSGRQSHERPQGQTHSTALQIPFPDVLSHGTTIPNLQLGVLGSNPWPKTLGLPIEMRKTPHLSYHQPCEPNVLPTPAQNRITCCQIYWRIQTI